jgi:hypothetical protein
MNNCTNFAEEFRLYENLFTESTGRTVLTEKNKSEFNNLKLDFDTEVEKISKGKSLSDIAGDLVSLLRSTIDEYRVYAIKNANHTTSNMSMKNSFEAKAKQILNFYANMIKNFKRPNNFYQAQSAISNVAEQILGDYLPKSSAYKRIEQYADVLVKVNELPADKKVKALELKEFFKTLIVDLTSDYKAMKNGNYDTLFD